MESTSPSESSDSPAPEQSVQDQTTTADHLIASLQAAFMDRRQAYKTEMDHVFNSTQTEITNCFKGLDSDLEPNLIKNLIRFNTACRGFEAKCLAITDIGEKFDDHRVCVIHSKLPNLTWAQKECNDLEEQIATHFTERDKLFTSFEESADTIRSLHVSYPSVEVTHDFTWPS